MARIRTVKPEFWTSEQIMEISPIARLLFIGLWNFCDDGGNHPASVKTLKAQIFPGDDLGVDDVSAMILELRKQGLIVEYETAGKRFWHVTGWQHQKIDKPTYKYPQPSETRPPLDEDSTISIGGIDDPSTTEGKGKEGNVRDINSYVPDQVADSCPHQQIINLYHEHLPMLTRVKTWTEKRANQLKSRWREDASRQNLEYWEKLFRYIAQSDFLTGKTLDFQADLEWITKSANFVKIIEGKYENKAA